MPKFIDHVQGSKEWKEWRRWKLGASIAASIMGVSPWQTKLQLWNSIILNEDKPPNFAMQRGTRLEEKAREYLNNKRGAFAPFIPMCLEHSTYPWMIASLDGWAVTWCAGKEIREAIEIKCPGKEAHSIALQGKIPPYYWPQLQHQMCVADLDEITYFSFDGENGVEIKVKRDHKYINFELLPALTAFYESIVNFKPPVAAESDVIQITDQEAHNAADRYFLISTEIARLEKELDEVKADLISYASHGRCAVGNLKISKVIRKGNIKYEEIPELIGIDLEKYRKDPIISWRLSGV